MNKSIFIGSSSESKRIVEAIQRNLSADGDIHALVVPWTQGVFQSGHFILEDLLNALSKSTFAIFVFFPDDTAYIRKKKYAVVRDNVLFEMGLFLGELGRERTFFVVPHLDNYDFRIPSDLAGVTFSTYNPTYLDDNIDAMIGPACTEIKQKIRAIGLEKQGVLGIERFGDFVSFDSLHSELLKQSSEITTCFIHSRRWRESNSKAIISFLEKRNSKWNVILPDLRDEVLFSSLKCHFADGTTMYAKIIDAYDYFLKLKSDYPKKITIYLSSLYPTYSLYQYSKYGIVSLYPLSDMKMSTPTFQIDMTSAEGDFFIKDIKKIISSSTVDDNVMMQIIEAYKAKFDN